jgi:hypothetical protein
MTLRLPKAAHDKALGLTIPIKNRTFPKSSLTAPCSTARMKFPSVQLADEITRHGTDIK